MLTYDLPNINDEIKYKLFSSGRSVKVYNKVFNYHNYNCIIEMFINY